MAVIILILVVGVIYLIRNPKTVYRAQNTPKEQKDLNSSKVEENKNVILNNENSDKVEMTSNEKYKIFANNLKQEVAKYGDTTNIKSVLCRQDKGGSVWYEVSLQANGNIKLSFGDNELDKKYGTDALVKNVLAFYVIDVGQDDWHQIYFIKEDGTVASANVDSVVFDGSGKIDITENISELKNIVSIIDGGTGLKESGTHCPLFIDIEGKVYNIFK